MPSTIFIHGLSNKPGQTALLELYKRKLAFVRDAGAVRWRASGSRLTGARARGS